MNRMVCENAMCGGTVKRACGFTSDFYRFKVVGGWTWSFSFMGHQIVMVNRFGNGSFNTFWG